MEGITYRGIVDARAARVILSRFLLPVEIEQAGIINAFGRTLAEDLISPDPIPSRNTAFRDGYAAIAADTTGATREKPRSLSILSSSSPASKRLEPGTVMRVRKDDPLPDAADTVIDPANTYRPENGPQLLILAEAELGANAIVAGSRAPAGQVLLSQGAAIGACEMELIASLGKHGVPVRRKPRIAIITSGARIVDVVGHMEPGELRNAARYALVGMVLGAGCDLGRLIHVREGRVGLEKALSQCAGCDAIIISISSHEKHDSSLEAISASGTRYFDRLQMDPGCCAFGIAFDTPVFATDNQHTLEAFEAVIRPGLLMMVGRENLDRTKIRAALDSTLKLNPGNAHFIKAITSIQGDICLAKPTADRCPNSLIMIPPNTEIAKRGEIVGVLML